MSHREPTRLLDGGLIDGEAASPEMLELLGALRGAVPSAAQPSILAWSTAFSTTSPT